jgi:hypothetical protein
MASVLFCVGNTPVRLTFFYSATDDLNMFFVISKKVWETQDLEAEAGTNVLRLYE